MKINKQIWYKTIKAKRTGEQTTANQRGQNILRDEVGTHLAECRKLGLECSERRV